MGKCIIGYGREQMYREVIGIYYNILVLKIFEWWISKSDLSRGEVVF